jgi:hypothetical protein
VDEVQYLTRPELAALVVACHEVAQRSLPFMFIGAGLPQMAALAGNAKSYAERLFIAAKAALVHPAEHEGVRFQDAAVVPMFDTFMKRQMPTLEKHEPKRRRVERRSRKVKRK